MKRIERTIERALLASRWLLLVFYAGLAVGLAIYAVSFVAKVAKVASMALAASDEELARQAAAQKRWTFLFVLAPLTVRGATGSPVNPIAVF